MKILIQINKSAIFSDKLYVVEPVKEAEKEILLYLGGEFTYNAASFDEALYVMYTFPSTCAIITENGQEGIILDVTDFKEHQIEKLILEWEKSPFLQEINKISQKRLEKRKFDEYLMGGSGTVAKQIKTYKADYKPEYNPDNKSDLVYDTKLKKLRAKIEGDEPRKVYIKARTKEELDQIRKDLKELRKETGVYSFSEVGSKKKGINT